MPKDEDEDDGDGDGGGKKGKKGKRGWYERLATVRASSPLRRLGCLAVSAEDVLRHFSAHLLFHTNTKTTETNCKQLRRTSNKQQREEKERENEERTYSTTLLGDGLGCLLDGIAR